MTLDSQLSQSCATILGHVTTIALLFVHLSNSAFPARAVIYVMRCIRIMYRVHVCVSRSLLRAQFLVVQHEIPRYHVR